MRTENGARATELTLVFPAGMPGAERFREQACVDGRRLLGASSLPFDPASADYDDWVLLPYVHAPEFATALSLLIEALDITSIFTPHEVVSGVLMEILPKIAPGLRLLNSSPMVQAQAAYCRDLAKAETASRIRWVDGTAAPIPHIERAGLVRIVDSIPGMTNFDKTDAIIDVMGDVLKGDVVEIGSWWGRSAALLLLLSRRYGAGPVLCIDPWRDECLHQGIPVLDQASARVDADSAFTIFQINLSPLSHGDLNYIRGTSAQAAAQYSPGLTVTTDVFGSTSYEGCIGLLHIDGNHEQSQVETDVRLWTPHVRPGGWIILDDYVWAFGDGPRRVGDAFLNDNAGRIDRSFVTGTALFMRIARV